MSRRLSALLLSAALTACAAEAPTPEGVEIDTPDMEVVETTVPTLTEGWVVEGLDGPESVIETEDGLAYYVSVIGGEISGIDNNGTIALISKDGVLFDAAWANGTDDMPLNAPKGMTLLETEEGVRLLVTDIDHLAIIAVEDAQLVARLPAPGATGLNDVAKGPGESAFISDSRNARIYKMEDGEITVWMEDERLAGINGLQMEGDALLVSTMVAGELLSIDLETKEITGLATGMVNADGIGVRDDGSYMVSSYTGQLWHVRPGETPTLLQDTGIEAVGAENAIGMNDVLFLKDVVVAPNFRPGSVRTYQID